MEMAIFHLRCTYGSRQRGQSALAKVSYVLREGKYAWGRDDLVLSGCANLPDWCRGDPRALFAAADRHERANGRLYVEVEVALPVELDLAQQDDLVRTFIAHFAPGLPYAYGVHAGRPTTGTPRNCHVHCLVSERVNDGILRNERQWFRRANPRNLAAGGAPKDRRLKAHGWVAETRHLWERLANDALEKAGCPERVTADSHRTRITRAEAVGDQKTVEYLLLHPPGMHIGPAAAAIERGSAGRPGRATERGELGRARAAKAARFRAGIEHVDRELQEHGRGAVAAARDAGVDDELVATAQSGNPDEVIALDVATDRRRQEIRAAAWALGLDDEAIEGVRREAEPDGPDRGWWAVVEATAERRERKTTAESSAGNVGLDVAAVYAIARAQDVDPIAFLEQKTEDHLAEIMAAARRELLDDAAIGRLFSAAESRTAGSGWKAVVDGTVERRQRRASAETAAGNEGLDVPAIYTGAGDVAPNADPVHYLEMFTEGRRALLNPKAIANAIREGESQQAGSGLRTLARVIVARCERKDAVETTARGLNIDASSFWKYCAIAAVPDTDPIDELEEIVTGRARDILAEARAVQIEDEEIARIHAEPEPTKPGSGWRAIIKATKARKEKMRDEALEASFTRQEIRIHLDREQTQPGSGWAALAAAVAERKLEAEIKAAAQEVLLDAEAIPRIRGSAESDQPGTGWPAVKDVIAGRRRRKEDAEREARSVGLDVESSYTAAAARKVDPLEALEHDVGVELARQSRRLEREETLVGQPGGLELLCAWATKLDPAWCPGGELTGTLGDQVLDAAESDGRLVRLTQALQSAEAASFFDGEVDTYDQVTLSQIDAALEGAEAISRRRAVPDAQREQIPATVDPKIEATVIAADRQADHGGPLTLDERARLARYLAEEQLPSTTPFPGNPSHRPFACGDATLEAAEAVAGPRRVAETIAAMGSRHSYTASARDDSERTYAMKKGLEPERMRDIVIQIVETAWRQVDRMDLPTANYELARLDRSHRHQGGRSTTPRLIVPSIEQPAKPRASTRADATAPTDEKPNRGWRGGR